MSGSTVILKLGFTLTKQLLLFSLSARLLVCVTEVATSEKLLSQPNDQLSGHCHPQAAQPSCAEVSSCAGAGDAEGGEGRGRFPAPSSSTYINEIRQVMDVVLEHRGIGGFQGQQILISCLNCLQSVFCVLCLALKDNKNQNIALKEVSSTLGNTREH